MLHQRDLLYFSLLDTLDVGAAQFFYLLAISKINGAAAILLHYTGIVFVAFYRGNAQPASDTGRHACDRIDYRAATGKGK